METFDSGRLEEKTNGPPGWLIGRGRIHGLSANRPGKALAGAHGRRAASILPGDGSSPGSRVLARRESVPHKPPGESARPDCGSPPWVGLPSSLCGCLPRERAGRNLRRNGQRPLRVLSSSLFLGQVSSQLRARDAHPHCDHRTLPFRVRLFSQSFTSPYMDKGPSVASIPHSHHA